MSENKDLKSYHIFMFPFKWDYMAKEGKLIRLSFEDRVKRGKFEKALGDDWQKDSFFIKSEIDYNEYKYFYEYARSAIYYIGYKDEKNFYPVYQYKYKRTGKFIIDVKDGKKYILKIDKILLKVYETGVAILSFHLANYQYSFSTDILKINDFGRRIYPQFLGKREEGRCHVDATKDNFLPNNLILELHGKEEPIEEDFTHFNNLDMINDNPDKTAKIISELLGPQFRDAKRSQLKKGEIYINPIIDDRMFVVCWYGNDIKFLGKGNQSEDCLNYFDREKEEYKYLEDDLWYKYIFMDGNEKTCQSKKLFKKLLENSTYDRWVDYGTLYGITPYSLVALSGKIETLRDNNAEFIVTHIQTMYYQMAALSLAQRASILRFSEEVSYISRLEEKDLVDRVRVLHKNYIQFVNRMYFKEITAQEQGIEMYDMLQKKMRIESDIKDLDAEINELHQYATLVEEKNKLVEEEKMNKTLNLLTIIGALFLIPSFFTGFFGMNIGEFAGENGIFIKNSIWEFMKNFLKMESIQQWIAIYFSIPSIALGGIYLIYFFREKIVPKGLRQKWIWIVIIFLLLAVQVLHAFIFINLL